MKNNIQNRLGKVFNGEIPELDYASLVDIDTTFAHNIENAIGYTPMPIGVVGPLTILGDMADGEYRLPLATTEACLVASVGRGIKAMQQAGGAKTTIMDVGVTRSMAFVLSDEVSFSNFVDFLELEAPTLQEVSQAGSSHLRLLDLQAEEHGKYVFVKGYFDPQDALGMNMVTIAMKQLAEVFEAANLGRLVTLSSNHCADKKPGILTKTEGRGMRGTASCFLPNTVLINTLKTTKTAMMEVYEAKIVVGSQLAGLLGQNAQHANIIAGFLAATGNDLAYVSEMSMGDTIFEEQADGILVSVDLPSIMLGVVGGGTSLSVQQQTINMIGLQKEANNGEKRKEMAEVLAAGVLAGEISLMGALASHDLASAHQQFRKKPTDKA